MHQKPFIVPIPGSSSEKHLMDNLGATEIVFTEAELKDIRDRLNDIEIHGDRYSLESQRNIDR